MTTYLCIGPYCWGKSNDTASAIRKAKTALPKFGSTKKMPYDLYEVHPDAYVDDTGRIMASEPPKKIREVRFVGDQRTVKEKFDAAPLPGL